jgi:hypothetical protein
MRTFFETELRDKLNGMGAAKLPPSVYDALVADISADIQAALTKSLTKRTKPHSLARLVHASLTKLAGDSKGDAIPFGQLRPASPVRDETETLIGASVWEDDVSLSTQPN